MKKIILLLAGTLSIIVACEQKVPDTVFVPGISFLDSYFEIAKGGEKVLNVAIDKPFDTETRVKVEITGGTLGEDYTLENGDEIVIGAGERTSEFKIGVPFDITESKLLTVKMINLPDGYDGGRFPVVTVKTSMEPTASFSFASSRVVMYGSTRSIEVGLYDMNGNSIKVPERVQIKITPDASSTAILGTHYKFLDDKDYAVIEAGKYSGYVTIESLLYEDGKNEIVFACGEPDNYYNGNIPFVTVVLPKSIDQGLIGSWKGLKWTSDLEEYRLSWLLSEDEIGQMASSISENDILTFNADGTLTVDMQGPLGHYFRNCNWHINGTERIVIGVSGITPIRIDAPKCELSVINYSFSNNTPQLQTANMKVYITYEIEYGDMLNIYVSEGDYGYENSPVPFFWGFEPLKYTFIRVVEDEG